MNDANANTLHNESSTESESKSADEREEQLKSLKDTVSII